MISITFVVLVWHGQPNGQLMIYHQRSIRKFISRYGSATRNTAAS